MQQNGRFTTAIHICIYIHFKGNKLVSSQTLAKSVCTNAVVIRRIMAKLKQVGIVGSVSGTKGGFFLKKEAHTITLWDIYLAMREQDLFIKPASQNENCLVANNLAELVSDAFSEAEQGLKSILSQTHVAQLSEKLRMVAHID